MVVMHGLFDLKEKYNEHEFKQAVDNFAAHLQQMNMLSAWRFMRRTPHPGYDARPPAKNFYVSVEFIDLPQSQECWAYVENNQEPLRSFHRAVNSKVKNTIFFLCEDVESENSGCRT